MTENWLSNLLRFSLSTQRHIQTHADINRQSILTKRNHLVHCDFFHHTWHVKSSQKSKICMRSKQWSFVEALKLLTSIMNAKYTKNNLFDFLLYPLHKKSSSLTHYFGLYGVFFLWTYHVCIIKNHILLCILLVRTMKRKYIFIF